MGGRSLAWIRTSFTCHVTQESSVWGKSHMSASQESWITIGTSFQMSSLNHNLYIEVLVDGVIGPSDHRTQNNNLLN